MLESKEASYVLGIIIGVAFVIIIIILANIYKHWKRIAKKAQKGIAAPQKTFKELYETDRQLNPEINEPEQEVVPPSPVVDEEKDKTLKTYNDLSRNELLEYVKTYRE